MSVISTRAGSLNASTEVDRSVWPLPVRWVHWLTVLLVVVAIAAVFGQDLFEEKSVHKLIMNVHKQAGVLVLILTGLRVAVRLTTQHPLDGLRGWSRRISTAAHGLIYLILFTLPVLGWTLINARGSAVSLFGWTLPVLLARDRDLADTLEEAHQLMGWTLMGLVVAHVLAAVWHHRVKKDRVLLAMLGRKA